uniref:Uncharacterized protein n=1 Tax=Arundo donax TaxID=35708 RepID=A0A0A8Y7J5_ARUDO
MSWCVGLYKLQVNGNAIS